MRCKACNTLLEEFEAVKKDNRGEYIDLCSTCHTVSLATEWQLEESDNTGTISLDEYLTDFTIHDII